ncbi:unnamed protein product [Cuscuta campestris]|uniref:Protein EARLY FLOWERING 3 n=1 Tax=Cuscuta campestris TaxID=132261 RepID=A0A484MZN9_9ASTE|nr:unnamed protein product [Cuscuta campestris]
MKGEEKDKEKRMDHHPIFPRLHISDADRRGPRAPPRNKMAALTEEPYPANSLPPISMLPLPPPNLAALSHADSNEKMFSTFCYPSGLSHPYASAIHFTDGEPSFTTPRNPNLTPINHQYLSDTGDFPSTSSYSFSAMKHGNDGDFSVPKFYHIGKHPKSGNIEKIVEKGKDTPSSSNVCNKIQSSSEKPSKESPNVIKKRNHLEKESCNLGDEYFEDDDEYGKMEKSDKKRSASMMEDNDQGPSQAGRNGDISNVSDVNLSPDDIVKMLGQKLFWKARKTILHQQRIFVQQIFELHRLIKVQKMIARSPDILFEDNFYTGKSLMTSSSTKKLPCTNAVEPKTYSSPKTKGISGSRAENIRDKKPILHEEPYSGLASPAHEAKSGPWCLPAANQWLVPLRSPSEGLVYKPYSGPCPPPGAILAPLYGGCRPLNISYGIGLFPSPSVGQAYFQPYAMPVINSSTRDPSLVKPYGTKAIHNTSHGAQSGIVSNGAHQSLQTDRGSDLQGSTASSPSERDALSLFPTKPTGEDSDRPVHNQNSRQAFRVIKVVPHKPNTASESAARIFKSIQEERKQH